MRDWRRPRYEPVARFVDSCARCWRPMTDVHFTPDDYAELLGLYLGDGHISELARTQRLRLSLDSRHPEIIADCKALLGRCLPANRNGSVLADRGLTSVLRVYPQHLACLVPSTGRAKKHDRTIELEPWQWAIVRLAPWRFLRGCIRSDGCVFVNRTGRYEYLSYDFSNLSTGILDAFVATCEIVGLRPRRYTKHVRLNRRDDVRQLVAHVGVKR